MNENRARYDITRYDRPAVPVDRAVFTIRTLESPPHHLPQRVLSILVVRRRGWPFAGAWALPGGFSQRGETLEEAGERELAEETGIQGITYRFLRPYSTPGRDPRGWIISMAYYGLVNSDRLHPVAGDDAVAAQWLPLREVLALLPGDPDGEPQDNMGRIAFDHRQIVADAYDAVRRDVHTSLSVAAFLPDEFTLSELLQILKVIDPAFDDRHRGNFMRKVLRRGILTATGRTHNRYARKQTATYQFTGHAPRPSQWE